MLGPSSHRRVVTTDPAASRPPSQAGRSQGRQEIGPRKNPTLGGERDTAGRYPTGGSPGRPLGGGDIRAETGGDGVVSGNDRRARENASL